MKDTTVSLRIASETMSPAQITELVGLKASNSYAIGDIAGPLKTERTENLWLLDFEGSSDASLLDQIEKLIGLLDESGFQVEELVKNATIEICCSYSSDSGQGGFVLSHQVVKRLSDIGADVSFSLYLF